jgi:hypothetical protein
VCPPEKLAELQLELHKQSEAAAALLEERAALEAELVEAKLRVAQVLTEWDMRPNARASPNGGQA